MKKYSYIFAGFMPNNTHREVYMALLCILSPWRWFTLRKGKASHEVENHLKKLFQLNNATTFDSGRSALYVALKTVGVKKGDIVIVQAYTCVVVINAIRRLGATPHYVDITDDLTMDVDELRKSITSEVNTIIVQHTFGQPADMRAIMHIAREHKLTVIEDCAQSFGSEYEGKKLGTIGDMAVLSFGSDKTFSSVRGGAVLTGNAQYAKSLRGEQIALPSMPLGAVFQHLLSFPFFAVGKQLYAYGIGKGLLFIARKFNIIARIMTPQEKNGTPSQIYPTKYPNALATILLSQLEQYDEEITHRNNIARQYQRVLSSLKHQAIQSQSVPMRFVIFVDKPMSVAHYLKSKGVFLSTDWTDAIIVPPGVEGDTSLYTAGECPHAELLTPRILTLPTSKNITEEQAKNIAIIIQDYVHSTTN